MQFIIDATRRPARLAVVAVVAALALSACGGEPAGGDGVKPTLTIALSSPPTSLDPSKGSGGSNATFQLPAYSSLLRISEVGGDPEPALAASWSWLDERNQTLEVVLRDELAFSDGTELDAAAVKTSIEHFAEAGSVFSHVALPIETIETPDDRTVVFHLSTPTPTFPQALAAGTGMGSIISPAVLADDPESLGTSTAGAGPYVLSDDTIEGSEYHYVPNPEYYDADAVPYSAVTIKVIGDPNTALASLQSGQVDIAYGYPDTHATATAAGLGADVYDANVDGLWIQDWDGSLVPALGDVRVRQAINFALDRAGIANAVTLGLGSPTAQTPIPGTLGHDPALDERYPYDPERAASLLAEAGYADGFDLPIIVPGFIPTANALAQAIAAQLGEIGIRVGITAATTFPEYAQAQESGTFGGTVVPLDMTEGVPSAMNNVFAPHALVNPRHGELPDVLAAVAAASELSGADAAPAWQEANTLIVEGAYAAPVMTEVVIFYFSEKVGSLGSAGALNPVFVTPSS